MDSKTRSILEARNAVVTIHTGGGAYGCTAAVVGEHDGRIRVRVTHANPGASVKVGDELAVPVERVGHWTSR